ncbi:MAG: hypothetical protein R3247_17055, partial [Rhodothermales bacterium]|nr:hypothetical protein [Rhodothermales bacterium]
PIEDLEARISPDGTMLAVARGYRTMMRHANIYGDVVTANADLYVASLSDLPVEPLRQLTSDHSSLNGLAWTPDSREIVYASDRVHDYNNLRLWRVPAAGGPSVQIPTRGDRIIFPAVSPDGRLLAYVEGMLNRDVVWRYALSGTDSVAAPPERLIQSSADEMSAEYSPDGRRIVFASRRSGNDEIWACDSDGSNPVQLTFLEGPRTGTPRWSPDGRFIAFDSYPLPEGKPRLFVIPSDGGTPRRVGPDSLNLGAPFWSGNGQWLYSGIWKVPVHGGRPLRILPEGSGTRESPDGQWLYYYTSGTDTLGSFAIWKTPMDGGNAELVLDNIRANAWRGWVMFDDGLYFMDWNDERESFSFKFFDFATGTTKILTQVPQYGHYFHVSPDREYLIAFRHEGGGVDLVALENWR